MSGSIIVLSSTVESYLSTLGRFLSSVLTLVPSHVRDMPFSTRELRMHSTSYRALWGDGVSLDRWAVNIMQMSSFA